MTIELHNIPAAKTEGKVSTIIIERGQSRLVFARIPNSNIVDVLVTPNISQEMKSYRSMILLEEFKIAAENLDLEEIDDWS